MQSLYFIMDGLLSHSAASTCRLWCEGTCSSVIFGLLVRKLNVYGLWPIPNAEILVESPFQLYKVIQSSFDRVRTTHQAMKIPHIKSICRTVKFWSDFIRPFERDIAFFSLSGEKRIHSPDDTIVLSKGLGSCSGGSGTLGFSWRFF